MAEHYIFSVTCIPGPIRGRSRPARDVLADRAKAGLWPLNAGTPFQEILSAGDRVLFYVSGKDAEASNFIAIGEVAGGRVKSDRLGKPRGGWGAPVTYDPLYDVPIRHVRFLETPLSIRPLLSELEFIKQPTQWGKYLQGGIRKIEAADYERVVARGRFGEPIEPPPA